MANSSNGNRPEGTDGPTASARQAKESTTMMNDRESQAISSELEELKRELAKLSGLVGEMATSRYRRFRDQAASVAGDVAHRGAELQEEAYARLSALEENLERRVRERPLTAVMIAAGIGYFGGLIWRWRR